MFVRDQEVQRVSMVSGLDHANTEKSCAGLLLRLSLLSMARSILS